MPTVLQFGNIRIMVFSNDHNPPHFHVIAAEQRASVRISDLELVAGSLDAKTARVVRRIAIENRKTLLKVWSELNG